MPSYYPKDDQVERRSLLVQRLVIPLFIGHNATPASKSIVSDEPSLLFYNTEGNGNCTVAAGAYDSSAEQSGITFASASDATGVFSILLRSNEPNALIKVMAVKCVRRDGSELICGTPPTGSSPQFLTSVGNKIVANFDSAVNLATTDGDYCIEVEYIAAQ